MNTEPLKTDFNGERDRSGRFTKGNHQNAGGHRASHVAKLRAELEKAVSYDDIRQIAMRLVSEAKNGNIRAIDLLLNRLLGSPVQADLIERLDELEKQMEDSRDEKQF